MVRRKQKKTLQEVYDIFLKTPGLPCLESDKVLMEAVRQGVRTGLLGARLGSTLYFGETPPDLSLDAAIVRPEKAEEEKKARASIEAGTGSGFTGAGVSYGGEWAEGEGRASDISKGPKWIGNDSRGKQVQTSSTLVKRINIKATVPWDKLSQVVTGVIRPLKAYGSDPEITLEIKAETENGFDRTTLDSNITATRLKHSGMGRGVR